MLRDDFEFYVCGEQNRHVPAHLNFGRYVLDRLRQGGDKVALVTNISIL